MRTRRIDLVAVAERDRANELLSELDADPRAVGEREPDPVGGDGLARTDGCADGLRRE